ncbi:hypothetical protein STXM2123_3904 [Streptomyces sp. F-3]|nr:hypothetical protein STXM2123_3904 [Streptomyces sp. F-3]
MTGGSSAGERRFGRRSAYRRAWRAVSPDRGGEGRRHGT